VPHLEELNLLMDKAKAITGSDSATARALGVVPQRVTNWRNGSATCQPSDQALIAHLAGLDPVTVLARATVMQYEGKQKGDLLMKALGKASLLTGVALGSVGASAQQIFSMVPGATDLVSTLTHWTQCALRLTQCALC